MKDMRTRPVTLAGWRNDPQARRFDIELPADPHDRIAILHQEAVAEVGGGRGILTASGAIESAEDALASAVSDLEQQRAVAACGVDGLKHIEVGGEVHTSITAARRRIEIDDGLVARICGIERELDRARQLFVRANRPKGCPLATTAREAIVTFVTSARARGGESRALTSAAITETR